MNKKLIFLTMAILILLSACTSGVPTTKPMPATSTVQLNPAGAYPSPGQPVNSGTYPEPGMQAAPLNYPAYPAPGEPSPYDPQAGDANLQRAEVTVDPANSQILLMETSPVQAVAMLIVQMPTPCHQPRVKVSPPDNNQNIALEVYAMVDPNTICTQVISQVEVRVSLGALKPGTYHVIINDQAFKDFKVE
jgi:hypothetical protein